MIIDKNLNNGREVIQDLIRSAKISYSKSVVVDIGAGEGKDLSELCKHEKVKIHAVESYPPNIKLLKNKNIITHDIDIESNRLPFESESVDLIIANQVLEHCKEVFWIFSEVSRVLKVNGKFILGVPNLGSLHNRILLLVGRQPTCININSAHVRGYTKDGVRKFSDQVFPKGYELLKFRGSNFYPFPPSIAKILSKLFPNFSVGMFFLLEKKIRYRSEFLKAVDGLATPYFIGLSE